MGGRVLPPPERLWHVRFAAGGQTSTRLAAGRHRFWWSMLQAGTKFDKYIIVRRLGEGGMSQVYEAENPFGIHVVLKMMHPSLAANPDLAERFRREGRIQYTLRHPNIVRVTDIVEHEGIPALVVDLMYGRDLEQALGSGGISIADALQVSIKVLDALRAAHERGFIHRDIKPSNVFLEDSDRGFEPRVMDFGIAKVMESTAELTRAEEFCGTPSYASPEQVESTRDVDARTDVYSFGVVLWQMVTGEEPYGDLRDDPYAVLAAVVRQTLPPVPESVPEWLRRIVACATDKNPDRRFQSAAHFRDALLSGANQTEAYASTMIVPNLQTGDYVQPSVPGLRDDTEEVEVEHEAFDLDSNPPTGPLTQTMSEDDIPDTEPIVVGPPKEIPKTESFELSTELRELAFGPLSSRAREGLKRRREREELERLAALADTEPDILPDRMRDAYELASEFQLGQSGVDQDGRATTEPRLPTPGPGDAATELEEREAKPEQIERARQVEASFGKKGRKPESEPRSPVKMASVAVLIAVGLAGGFIAFRTATGPTSAPAGFVRVEPGTFAMGSPEDEVGRLREEVEHRVTITRPFAIQLHEVTQEQWVALMYSQPDNFADCGASCPMMDLSWLDAIRYANRLSLGHDACYVIGNGGRGPDVEWPEGLDCNGYRLPTEAEWEYASRAGATGAFQNGDLVNPGRELLDPHLSIVGWYGANSDVEYRSGNDCSSWGEGRDRCGLQPVGTRRPNNRGMHDVSGNVAEWVWDRYGLYGAAEVVDPLGSDAGNQRVVRGGSWRDTAESCRLAARDRSSVGAERSSIGFRLARTLR